MLTVACLRFHLKMTTSGQRQTLSRWVKPHIDNTKCICVLVKQHLATPVYPGPTQPCPSAHGVRNFLFGFPPPRIPQQFQQKVLQHPPSEAVCVLYMCICTCMCRYTGMIQKSTQAVFLYWSSPLFFKRRSPLNLGSPDTPGSSCLSLSALVLQAWLSCLAFSGHARDLNLGPHACAGSSLPIKPLPHSWLLVFICFFFKIYFKYTLASESFECRSGEASGPLELELQATRSHLI